MNLEAINKWLDEEYGCSYTRLEELHDFYFENYCDLKKENKQLKAQIEEYQQENKILKENAENNDKVVDKVNWDNMLLKKENQDLKKQLENKYEKVGTLTSELLYEENTKLINQQKEFINYLEKRYKDITSVIGSYGSNTDMLYGKKDILEEIFQEFKSIIGDDK